MRSHVGLKSVVLALALSCGFWGSGCFSNTSSSSITMRTSAPTISKVSPFASSGFSGSLTLQISSLPFTGGKLKVYADSTCQESNLALQTDVPTGALYLLLQLSFIQAGAFSFSAKAIDPSMGDWSSCSAAPAQYTVLSPSLPSALTLFSPSVSPAYDSTPEIRVTGTGSGLTVKLYTDSTCTTEVASRSAFASAETLTSSALATGSHSFYAKNINDTGLASACSSASVAYTYSPPPVPTSLTLITPASSPGTNSKPTIRVGGVGNGVTANLYTDSTCSTRVASASASSATVDLYGGSAWTSALSVGSHTLYSNTNIGATYSSCSSANVAYTLNYLSTPSALTLVTPASSTSYFQTPTVSISGVSSGKTVTLYTDSACSTPTLAGSATASATSVNITVNRSLGAGAHQLYAKVADSSYGQSQCSTATLSYTVSPRVAFPAYQRQATTYRPHRVVAADFNSDGKLDFLTANYQSSAAGLFFGNGDGTFQANSPWAVGTYMNALAAGDLNADGRLDVIFGQYASSNVRVFIGNGDGTFQSGTVLSTVYSSASGWPEEVLLNDLNGDGKLDLIVGQSMSNNIVIRLGNGDGTFQTLMGYSVASMRSVAAGDVNADGKLDLVAATATGVSVFFGNGDGTLQAKVDYAATGGNVQGLTLVDLDANGSLDLALARGSSGFTTFINNGSGVFGSEVATSITSGFYKALVFADLDGDTRLDAIASDGSSNGKIVAHYGASGGGYDLPETFATDSSVESALILDLDGNGNLDIVACTDYTLSSIVYGSLSVLKR